MKILNEYPLNNPFIHCERAGCGERAVKKLEIELAPGAVIRVPLCAKDAKALSKPQKKKEAAPKKAATKPKKKK